MSSSHDVGQQDAARRGPGRLLSRLAAWLWSQPWLVLAGMALLFGANSVAARLASGAMPPLCLVFLRWVFVSLALAAIFSRAQWIELGDLVRHHWRRLAWMGLLGFTGYNAIFYTAAHSTSAVNLSLLQAAIPPFALAGAALVFGMRVRALQVVGMIITIVGVLVVAAGGDLGRLSRLHLGRADAAVLFGSSFYAAYALGLRARPKTSALVFFAGVATAAAIWAAPLAAAEIATGHAYWPSLRGWLVTLFIGIGPSFIGQLCFMRGVDLIGPGRAGLATNLVPITGALCAVVVLDETFTLAHAVALVLGLGGIALAEWSVVRGLRNDAARMASVQAPLTDSPAGLVEGSRLAER